jgi:hypothetical protein
MPRMKIRAVIVVGLVVAAGVWMIQRSSSEERIARRLGTVCQIARDNVKTPARGVDRLFAHLDANTAETLRDLGELVVEVQRIGDEKRHAERARRANRVLRAPLESCRADLDRFSEAINGDEAATRKLEAGIERLNRTLGLLFGDAARDFDARALFRR